MNGGRVLRNSRSGGSERFLCGPRCPPGDALFLPLYGTSSVTFLCKLLPRQWRRSGTRKQSVFETVAGAWWRAHSDQPSAVAGSCLGLLHPGILAVFFLVITKVTPLCSFAAQNLEGTPESPWGA